MGECHIVTRGDGPRAGVVPAGGPGKIPPLCGGNVAKRQREDPPAGRGECHEMTRGDGLRERTGRVRRGGPWSAFAVGEGTEVGSGELGGIFFL